MKILGISGSNRKNGNSYLLLKEIFKGLSSHERKVIQIAELDIKPCELCFEACAQKPFECVIKDDFKMLFDEMKSPCALIAVSASASSFNAFQILHHLQEFVLMLRMRPVVTNFWPFIGLSVKSGGMEKGAILKETKSKEQAKELLRLLVKEIERAP